MGKDSEQHFEDAQSSFRLASTATTIEQAVRLSDLGRDYLRMAREHVEVATKPLRVASMWSN
jgi:hypothetical protein